MKNKNKGDGGRNKRSNPWRVCEKCGRAESGLLRPWCCRGLPRSAPRVRRLVDKLPQCNGRPSRLHKVGYADWAVGDRRP